MLRRAGQRSSARGARVQKAQTAEALVSDATSKCWRSAPMLAGARGRPSASASRCLPRRTVEATDADVLLLTVLVRSVASRSRSSDTGHTDRCPAWRSAPTARARLRRRRQDGAAVGRGDRPTRRRTADRPHRRGVSVAFSPDGTRLASGSDDTTVRLWDAATGQPVGQPLTGHTDAVSAWRSAPTGTARLRQ